MGTKRFGIALLVAAVGVGGALEHLAREVGEVGEVGEVPLAAWPAGTTVRYRVAWTMDTELASQGQGSLAGHLDLGATLELTGAAGGAIAARFTGVARHRLELLGSDALAAPGAERALVGPVAWIHLDDAGAIAHVDFAADAPPVFRHVMLGVAGLAYVAPRDTGAWTAIEPGPSGTAEVTYHRTGALLTRTRDRYAHLSVVPATVTAAPALAATATIELDAQGRVAALTDDEQLEIPGVYHGSSRFSLALERTGRAAPPPPALSVVELHPGAPEQASDTARQHLEQRAAGVTYADVVAGVLHPVADRTAKRAWFVHAAARLALEPERCAELVELAFTDGVPERSRSLAFDLLAAAGTREAQAAMRDALDRPAAQPQQVALVQRLSLVTAPDADTAQFLLARAASPGDTGTAVAYAMGAVAGHLRASDPAAAAKLERALADQLARARTPDERATAIASLGNAASVTSIPAIAAHAHDAAPEVRDSAAWALRSTDSPAARAVLVDLATDDDARVAASALAALARQPLVAADLDALETALVDHPLPDAARGELVTLLGAHTDAPATRRMLEALAQAGNDPSLQERARVVLAQLP